MQPIVLDNNNVLYPLLKVNPTYSVIYYKSDKPRRKTDAIERQFLEMRNNKKFDGELSGISQQKIKNLVNWILAFSDEKEIIIDDKIVRSTISFITLTLPSKQIHSDYEIKEKCLNQFLIELKKKHPEMLYIWKAEKQKNGSIHFHITTNIVEHYESIQNLWNRIIEKLGYITAYSTAQKLKFRNGFYFDLHTFEKYGTNRDTQFLRYKKALSQGFKCPHSTEIKNVQKVHKLAAYICKYISKNSKEFEEAKEQYEADLLEFKTQLLNNEISEDVYKWSVSELEKEYEKEKEKLTVKGRIYGCSKFLERINITLDLCEIEFNFNGLQVEQKDYVKVVLHNITELLQTPLNEKLMEKLIEIYKTLPNQN